MDFRDKKLFSFSLLFLAVISCTSALFGADQDVDSRRRVARLCTQLKPQACAAIARQQHANEKTATSRTRWEAFADEYLKNFPLRNIQKTQYEFLFEHLRPQGSEETMAPYLEDVWRDIKLYHNPNNPEGSVLDAISRCQTLSGHLTLGHEIGHLITNTEKLLSKQETTRSLASDQALLSELLNPLEDISKHEDALMLAIKDFDSQKLMQTLGIVFTYINRSAILSDINIFTDLLSLASLLINIPLLLFKKLIPDTLSVLEEMKQGGIRKNLAEYLKNLMTGTNVGGNVALLAQHALREVENINSVLAIQQKLIQVSHLLRSAREIHRCISQNPIARKNIKTPFLDLLFLHRGTLPKPLQRFMSYIFSRTFKGKPSYFSRYGQILTTAYYLAESKEFFTHVLEDIGRIDAAASVAQLMKETSGTQNEYCFAEYVSAEKPYVALQNFWNPQLEPNIAVSSSIELGQSAAHQNALVMGPNGGGKSTAASAIFFSLYLGETLGICPALTARFTPFNVLATFMEIPDDITSNLSKFMAEGAKIKNVLNLTRHTAQHGDKIYLYMDEIITGTDPEHAAAIAYAVTKKLGLQPHIMLTLCTHYPNLAKLGTEYQDHFGLYTVPSQVETNESITHSYRLKQGAYTSGGTQFATLRGQGVDENIIQEAKHIMLQSKL